MGDIIPGVASHGLSFCTFRAGDRLCGIDVLHVREISTQVSSTPVPQAPAMIRGLVNLRSRIHLVADLRPVFGLAPVECTPDSRLIIFKEGLAEGLGILVDQVGDIVGVSSEQIEPSPADAARESQAGPIAHAVYGVCKLEDELMIIIDPVKLVAFIEMAMR
jgi:purine-binding chemotaxis protein CheW